MLCDGKREGLPGPAGQVTVKEGMGFPLSIGNMVHRTYSLSRMIVFLQQVLYDKQFLKCIILLLQLVYSCICLSYTL